MIGQAAIFHTVRRLNRREFHRVARDVAAGAGRQGADYLREHSLRLWRTYALCARYLGPGARFASVGAGTGYVEAALVESLGAKGTVLDLPDVVAAEAARYAGLGLSSFGVDLSGGESLAEVTGADFDLVLSAEIVEHLPVPASAHFGMLEPILRPGGVLVVGTPNAGSIRRVVKTFLHIPVLPPAELTFGPVDLEHEGVHRREYMPVEIRAALRAAGLRPDRAEYLSYGYTKAADYLFAAPEAVVPLWRNGLNIVGVKPG